MSLYREELIEDARNPKHFGKIEGAAYSFDAVNATCGDEVAVYIDPSDDWSTIERASFTGRGCMVTMASASRLLTHIQGMPIQEIRNMTADDALKIFGAPVTPGRLDCVLIPYLALKKLKDSGA